MSFKHACLILSVALTFSTCAYAAPIYSDNFDAGTSASNWALNASAGDNVAAFAFDYSSVGIPSAPNSTGGTTIGLKLQSNRIGQGTPTYTGLSVSPLGLSLSGDYELHADVWINYNVPNGGGSGTTQHAGMGIMTDGASPQWQGTTATGFPAVTSVFGQVTVDGGNGAATNNDYRVAAPTPPAITSPPYSASGTAIRDNANAYYTTAFPSITVPASLTHGTDFPAQTGATPAGVTAFAWRDWSIVKSGNTITWAIDGKSIAVFDATTVGSTSGSNILLNYSDSNAGKSADATSEALLFALYDNVRVVPEPASAGLMILGFSLVGLFRRER